MDPKPVMTKREDYFLEVSELVNRSTRQLTDGQKKPVVEKLRLYCLSCGTTGMLQFSRLMRSFDMDAGDKLSCEQFEKGIRSCGFKCTDEEMIELFNSLQQDEDKKTVNVTALMNRIRGTLTSSRRDIIDKAFTKLDKNNEGIISTEILRKSYSVKDHPKYQSGEMTKNEILSQFVKYFEGRPGNKVTKEDFLNYYSAVSAAIENNAFFDLALRRSYKL